VKGRSDPGEDYVILICGERFEHVEFSGFQMTSVTKDFGHRTSGGSGSNSAAFKGKQVFGGRREPSAGYLFKRFKYPEGKGFREGICDSP
jgi:hypothetical protein